MSAIDTTYFYQELSIAQISQPEVAASLTAIIDFRENELLTRLMGYELKKAYDTGILANSQIFKDIRDGKEYTDSSGRLTKWVGLAFTVGTSKKSLIANYVYYWYMRDNYTFTTGGSEKKSPAVDSVSIDAKLVRAWNEMVAWNFALHNFLIDNADIYPEYENAIYEESLFIRQNTHNL